MDWSFLDVFWAMCVFFAWVFLFWLLITVLTDLYRRHDIGGWGKTLWTVFVIVLPFLGVFIYLITQGRHMERRNEADIEAAQARFDARVKLVAGGGGPAQEIATAKELLDAGAITQAEFEAVKAHALGSAAA